LPEREFAQQDLALLTDAARAAGDIALRYFRNAPKVWEKLGEGPVTEADIAVNDMVMARLRAARPAYGWLSEESPDTEERLDCEHLFLIDPSMALPPSSQGIAAFRIPLLWREMVLLRRQWFICPPKIAFMPPASAVLRPATGHRFTAAPACRSKAPAF